MVQKTIARVITAQKRAGEDIKGIINYQRQMAADFVDFKSQIGAMIEEAVEKGHANENKRIRMENIQLKADVETQRAQVIDLERVRKENAAVKADAFAQRSAKNMVLDANKKLSSQVHELKDEIRSKEREIQNLRDLQSEAAREKATFEHRLQLALNREPTPEEPSPPRRRRFGFV